MQIQKPIKLHWTSHSLYKMAFYRLSEGLVKRILRSPKRVEDGIAPNTIAMMQSAGTKKNPYEVWIMVQDLNGERKIISAWRYPGKTKERGKDALDFLRSKYDEAVEIK